MVKRPILFGLYFTLIALSLQSLASSGLLASQQLYDDMSKAVVRLQHSVVQSGNNTSVLDTVAKPDGTAFIVRYNELYFLVTARHVANCGLELWSRVVFKTSIRDSNVVVWLKSPKESWILHPNGGDSVRSPVDVAVSPIQTKYLPANANDPDIIITAVPWSWMVPKDPEPLQRVVVAGFPSDLGFDLIEQRPLLREGVIGLTSKQPWVKIAGKFLDERSMIIDCPIFAGNSGSPVFILDRVTNTTTLVGIVIATNTNLDFGVAEPISRILETLEHAMTVVGGDDPKTLILPRAQL